jgi:2-polyprenyl-6-methoxyphenol hydroxylase-like FAD-dependent oxidoreductase
VVGLSGSWSAAELPHRVSQKFVEAVLRRHAESLPGISVNYGWRLVDFETHADRIDAVVERVSDGARTTVRGSYLAGADGPRSMVRQKLGFRYSGEAGAVRDFLGGRMYAVYLRAPDYYRVVPHAPAWMNVTFNRDRRALMAAVDGKGEFAFHTQLRDHERAEDITEAGAHALFEAAVGAPLQIEILARDAWNAGYTLVAEHFQSGRVFLGGDAVHLFTPTGGLGYNTAIEDAVNLGWKLAAAVKGQAGQALLDSYEAERRPLASRNTAYAGGFADSLGRFEPVAEIEDASPAGEAARRQAGAYLDAHARSEFNIPGITFGGRYDGSPVIVADGSTPPPDLPNAYVPTATPGGRAPHLWLAGGRSLYDTFGFEWTLLQLGAKPGDSAGLQAAARSAGLDLHVTHVPTEPARDLYGADHVLIRPDQIVAWRGQAGAVDGDAVIARVTGRS